MSIALIKGDRELRDFAEEASGWQRNQFGKLSEKAEEAFAQLQEYFKDCGDINDCYSSAQKSGVNQDLQVLERVMRLS